MLSSPKKNKYIAILFFLALAIIVLAIFLPKVLSSHYSVSEEQSSLPSNAISSEKKTDLFKPSYVQTPEPLKAIYMTSWVASDKKIRANLIKIIDDTEINSIVIDIKDYSGNIVFPLEEGSVLKKFGSGQVRVSDMRDFIESLHKKGIYVIGRVAVFQDAYFVNHRPDLAIKNSAGTKIWKDRKGISWIDVSSKEYWDYIIEIAKESRRIGFDEINFDYIRFPSDGNMDDISFPWSSTTTKTLALKGFFQYLHSNLKDSGLKTSADIFGMVTTANDDMGIGQVLENTLPYFDYIMPMVYPSHYPLNFQGFKDPEAHPYEMIKYSMSSAIQRSNNFASTTGIRVGKLRPWLQDFGLRVDYGPKEVRDQIRATNDLGLESWALWSASNKYTAKALDSE